MKKVPEFQSDAQAQAFLDQDLSGLDFAQFRPAQFELRRKDTQVNLRMPGDLLRAVKDRAAAQGVPYQRYIRHALERALEEQA